jgi:hypothetical protein
MHWCFLPATRLASRNIHTYWTKYQKADKASTLCTLCPRRTEWLRRRCIVAGSQQENLGCWQKEILVATRLLGEIRPPSVNSFIWSADSSARAGLELCSTIKNLLLLDNSENVDFPIQSQSTKEGGHEINIWNYHKKYEISISLFFIRKVLPLDEHCLVKIQSYSFVLESERRVKEEEWKYENLVVFFHEVNTI